MYGWMRQSAIWPASKNYVPTKAWILTNTEERRGNRALSLYRQRHFVFPRIVLAGNAGVLRTPQTYTDFCSWFPDGKREKMSKSRARLSLRAAI